MPAKNKLEVIIVSDYSEANSLAVTRKTSSLKRRDSEDNATAVIQAAYQLMVNYLAKQKSVSAPNGRYPAEGAYESYHAGVHADVVAFLRSDEEDGDAQSPIVDNEGQSHRSYFSLERIPLHNS